MKKRSICIILMVIMLIGLIPVSANTGTGDVASVTSGGTTVKYQNIDDAISNWTANSTLTLLNDVTLSDVITLKSTEHHILDLSTFTMTAASGKNAIVIQACGTGDSERSAITINANATDPGGINAGKKSVIYYKYADGGISGNDRPIIKITGGVFTGSTSSFGTAGIYTIGKAARKCATLNISGGTFNCSINGSGKSKLLISGGTFNYTVSSQGDSTCYRLLSGGTFKTLGFMTADSNNTKFWIGTSMGNSNVGVYVDDEGYLVVGGPVITEAGTQFEASTNKSKWGDYLAYSSAKDELFYTDITQAMKDSRSKEITVYLDSLDMSGSTYSGILNLPEKDSTLTVTYNEDETPKWTVETDIAGWMVVYNETSSGGIVTRVYSLKPSYKVNHYQQNVDKNGYTLKETDTLCGDVSASTEAAAKAYEGFTAQSFNQGEIKDDGSTTVDIYYNRNSYDITYVDNFANEVIFENQTKEGVYGTKIPAFDGTLEKTGYTFGGWYKDAECSEVWDLETETVKGAHTLYAKWNINLYTVKYIADGEIINTQSVFYGNNATPPAIPEKEGYTVKWESDGKNITSNTEINAVYTINTYTVNYIADGEIIDTQTIEHGKDATAPAIPEKEGHNETAPAWDNDGKNITSDTEITAVYTKNQPGQFKNITPTTNYGNGKITDTVEELKKAVGITKEEKTAAEYGADISVWLEVEDITKTISAAEKALIKPKLGDYTSGKYLDITMFKQVGEDTAIPLSKLEKTVTIEIELDDSLISANREYRVIHLHDGQPEIIPAEFDEKTKVLSFETDGFSTYAIAYKDAVKSPVTKDNTNLYLWTMLIATSTVVLFCTTLFKRKAYLK